MLKYNPNCTNKHCYGGVIITTGKACIKCNPEYSTHKISVGAKIVLEEAGVKELLIQDTCTNEYFNSIVEYIDAHYTIKPKKSK